MTAIQSALGPRVVLHTDILARAMKAAETGEPMTIGTSREVPIVQGSLEVLIGMILPTSLPPTQKWSALTLPLRCPARPDGACFDGGISMTRLTLWPGPRHQTMFPRNRQISPFSTKRH